MERLGTVIDDDYSQSSEDNIQRAIQEINQFSWDNIDADNFWEAADTIQDKTLSLCDSLFSKVSNMEPELLKQILVQYRFFTVYYIPDLALLISRLNDGQFRSFLGDILFDELGQGDYEKAHPQLYDNFLYSLGFEQQELNDLCLKNNLNLLDDDRITLVDPTNSSEFGVGLRGMGGECICQIYIAQLHKHLMENPYIQENIKNIDWAFWDLHVGEHDVEHRMQTRKLINSEFVIGEQNQIAELGRGYSKSIISWNKFWTNIFDAAKQGYGYVDMGSVKTTVNVQIVN